MNDDNIMNNEHQTVDAVFVIGTGSVDDNRELMYALRNLDTNCRFIRDVYICGYCPNWVDKTKVKHLQWPDRFKHAKDANIIDKLRHACEAPGIAKNILFCSDDQFNTRVCTWDDFEPRYLRRYDPKDVWYAAKNRVWHTRLRKTLEREVQRRKSSGMDTRDVFYYQPHMWMQIDRDRFIEYAEWCGYEKRDDTIIASGYFNFIDAGGKPDFDHTFLGSNEKRIPDTTHVAYHDGSYKAALSILGKMFPEKSRFEIDRSISHESGHMSRQVSDTRKPPVKVVSAVRSQGAGIIEDRTPPTSKEVSEIMNVFGRIRSNDTWKNLLGEVSMAEEMRLFRCDGWRIVWRDIISRWSEATRNGELHDKKITSKKSKASADAISSYVEFRKGLRERVRSSLHNRPK